MYRDPPWTPNNHSTPHFERKKNDNFWLFFRDFQVIFWELFVPSPGFGPRFFHHFFLKPAGKIVTEPRMMVLDRTDPDLFIAYGKVHRFECPKPTKCLRLFFFGRPGTPTAPRAQKVDFLRFPNWRTSVRANEGSDRENSSEFLLPYFSFSSNHVYLPRSDKFLQDRKARPGTKVGVNRTFFGVGGPYPLPYPFWGTLPPQNTELFLWPKMDSYPIIMGYIDPLRVFFAILTFLWAPKAPDRGYIYITGSLYSPTYKIDLKNLKFLKNFYDPKIGPNDILRMGIALKWRDLFKYNEINAK